MYVFLHNGQMKQGDFVTRNSFHRANVTEIREHIEVELALVTHSVGILPAEVTCQAVEVATPESGRVPFELLPRNGRSLVLEALFSKRINSRRNPHLNIHVRYCRNNIFIYL
ncbi:hypothetical protein DMN91_002244 [Ooceraea biroi]|uniref:Uncharacterized protein n=1 Tax=Ooceraea biroi TaxID=2015173 RepID=A0A3L8E040_OOCBI|nr:hypothetical protein DMN91_002244 [Ooceraea biroi]